MNIFISSNIATVFSLILYSNTQYRLLTLFIVFNNIIIDYLMNFDKTTNYNLNNKATVHTAILSSKCFTRFSRNKSIKMAWSANVGSRSCILAVAMVVLTMSASADDLAVKCLVQNSPILRRLQPRLSAACCSTATMIRAVSTDPDEKPRSLRIPATLSPLKEAMSSRSCFVNFCCACFQ